MALSRRTWLALAGLGAVLVVSAGLGGYWISRGGLADSATVLDAEAAHRRALAGEIVLVDIRRPDEWRRSGVPAGSHAITMHQDMTTFLAELARATKGDPAKPVALICATGGRTTWLAPYLEKAGFSRVQNVAEGMFGSGHGKGWLSRGLPVRPWQGSTASRPAPAR